MDPDAADDERDPLERLTAEFLDRRRSGEAVDLETFAAEHPAHADGIRALFPTLLQLEGSRSPEPARSRDRGLRGRGRGATIPHAGFPGQAPPPLIIALAPGMPTFHGRDGAP